MGAGLGSRLGQGWQGSGDSMQHMRTTDVLSPRQSALQHWLVTWHAGLRPLACMLPAARSWESMLAGWGARVAGAALHATSAASADLGPHLKGPVLQSTVFGGWADATMLGCSSALALGATLLNAESRLRLLPAAGRFLPFFWP